MAKNFLIRFSYGCPSAKATGSLRFYPLVLAKMISLFGMTGGNGISEDTKGWGLGLIEGHPNFLSNRLPVIMHGPKMGPGVQPFAEVLAGT